jgi:outer membrane receptor protein involved in Fe transport
MQFKAIIWFILFFLVGNIVTLHAQQLVIKGIVHDQSVEESLPFAQVALYRAIENICIGGGLSDNMGKFAIEVSAQHSYKLQIHFLGYESYETTVSINGESVDLGIICLVPSAQNLQEIFVTAEKKSIGKENGNWVLYPDKLPEAGTISATELLSTIPSVNVDIDDEINIRGRQASILIDGVKIDDQSEFDQISPSSIAKIEVIQNPSAKYDADGSVINIQLKAPIQSSSSSNLKASADHLGNHQESFSANSKYKNWGAFVQANSNLYKFDSEIKMNRTNLLSKESPYLNQNKNQSLKSNKQQIRAGLNHNLSKKHLVKLDAQWQNHQADPSILTEKEILNTNQKLKKSILQDQQNEKNKISQQYRGHYIGKWEKETLNVQINHNKQKQRENREVKSINYDPEGNAYNPLPSIKKDDINWTTKNYQVKIDYEKSISSSTQIETGINWKYEIQNQDVCQQKFNRKKEKWIIVPAKTFDYEYSMGNYASYGIVQIKRNKWFLTCGARFRFIELRTKNSKESIINRQYNFYPNILPTLNIGVNWEDSDLSFSYKKSQKLPKASQLNSYKNDVNPLNINFGNPDLKPEKEHSFSLDYSIHKDKFQLGVAFFQRTVKDLVMQEYYMRGDTLFRSFENISDQFIIGNECTFNYKPSNWCRLNGSSTIYHQKFTGSGLALPQKQIWSYNFKISSQIQLPKNLNFMLNYTYNSETLDANGLKGELYNLDIALSRSFFNKKLKISLKAANLLDSKKQYSNISNLKFISRSSKYQDSRRLILGMIYKWNKRVQ